MNVRLAANIIYVRDTDEARDWYERVLGMELVVRKGPVFMQMRLGGNTFYVETYSEERAWGFQGNYGGGRTSVVFGVADIEAFIEHCRSLDVNVVVPVSDQPWGGRNAVIADPSGNEFVIEQS